MAYNRKASVKIKKIMLEEENPLVSVIIPNYNHALYIEQRIETVLNQTFQDFELIILDDCSTDNSRDILDQYNNHPKIRLLFNEQNSGSVFKQWEKGINLAKGEYIWIAESDDYAGTNFLEELLPIIKNDKSIGLIFSDTQIVENDTIVAISSRIKNSVHHNTKWSDSYIHEGLHEIQESLIKSCTINNASSVLFRRAALATVFPFPYLFKYSGDYFTYIAIASKYKIAYVAKPLNFLRDHSNNTFKKVGINYLREHFVIYNWLYKHTKISKNEIAFRFADNVVPKCKKMKISCKPFIFSYFMFSNIKLMYAFFDKWFGFYNLKKKK